MRWRIFAIAIDIIQQLQRLGAKVKVYDPIVNVSSDILSNSGVILSESVESLATDCDALLLVTEWDEFRQIDFQHLATLMNRRLIIDGRNYLNPSQIRTIGFEYYGIGSN